MCQNAWRGEGDSIAHDAATLYSQDGAEPAVEPSPMVREYRADIRGCFPVDCLLPVTRDGCGGERRCGSHHTRPRFSGAAELRSVLLRARDARHEDRTATVCCGEFNVRNHRRLPDARPTDGPSSDWLV